MIENPGELAKLLSQGVYVIGVAAGERRNAFTAAWVMQVSFDPFLLAISINPKHHSYQLLQSGGICSVNVLGDEQMALAAHFGRSVPDKMDGFAWFATTTGAPILKQALAYFDCRVSHAVDAGDHRLVICEVVDAAVLNAGKPMLYSATQDLDASGALYKTAPTLTTRSQKE